MFLFFYSFLFSLDFRSVAENPSETAMIITEAMIISIAMASNTGIQRGDVTHHQDQEISPVSLSVRNIRNSTIVLPTPDDDLDDAMLFSLYM